EFHKNSDLAAQNLRHHRREYVIHCTEGVAARGLHLIGIGRHKNNGSVCRLWVLTYELCRLDSVDVRHIDVEEYDGEFPLEELAQRSGTRSDHDQILPELIEHVAEGEQLLRCVVD